MQYKKAHRTGTGKAYIIRDIKPDDAAGIINLINQVGEEITHIVIERFSHSVEWERNYIEHIDKDNVLNLVVELNRTIIGMIHLEREQYGKMYHTATLGMIIQKDYRNIGIGSTLLNAAFTWGQKIGIKKICLSCFSTNKAALALYKKFNFEEEGRRKNQFLIKGRYVDEVLMARWI